MLLPFATDRIPTRRPIATCALLALHVGLSLILLISDRIPAALHTPQILQIVGIIPAHFKFYTLFTYLFFHADPGHMFVNVFYLWVFGAGVEEAIGSLRFVTCYLIAGIFAGLVQCIVTWSLVKGPAEYLPIVGASASCAALIGLFAVRYYRSHLSFAGLPFKPHVVYVITAYLIIQIAGGIYEVATASTAAMVAYWAHLGGFVFGLTTAYALRLEEAGKRAYLTADAARAMERSMPGDAIKRWEALLAREPQNATARAELARSWLALGDIEQAGHNYEEAIAAHLRRNSRSEAALLYAEIRERHIRTAKIDNSLLFVLGNALEELDQYDLAADTLRTACLHAPDAPEAETATLKIATLYIQRLNRREEARILLRLFMERYPTSQFRRLASDLMAQADHRSAGSAQGMP